VNKVMDPELQQNGTIFHLLGDYQLLKKELAA
jgi:hypothetical protein